MKPLPPRACTALPATILSVARPRPHRSFNLNFGLTTTTTASQRYYAKMPPPPPNPPLSYTTSPTVNPYLVPYHPVNASAATDPRELISHHLCVGAAVLNLAAAPPRILVLQRAAAEKALPHRWELPGGAAESVDGNLVASAARELWEETGLRASRVAGLVGSYQWAGLGPSLDAPVVPGDQALALPGGGVGIAGVGVGEKAAAEGGAAAGSTRGVKGRSQWRKFTYLVEVETAADGQAGVVIDPEEHEAFAWATEEEVRADRCGHVQFEWTSEHQKQDILKAFDMVKKK